MDFSRKIGGAAVSVSLSESLPDAEGQWQMQSLPLGETEAVEGAVEETLQFDRYVNRAYTKGPFQLTVYAAYRSPGKMPIQLVASHTPDRCWQSADWSCSSIQFKVVKSIGELTLKPTEFRVFNNQDKVQHILLLALGRRGPV